MVDRVESSAHVQKGSAILPDSTADVRSDDRRSKAVSIEWKRPYADWLLDINLLLFRFFVRRDATTFFRDFEMKGRFDTGRYWKYHSCPDLVSSILV